MTSAVPPRPAWSTLRLRLKTGSRETDEGSAVTKLYSVELPAGRSTRCLSATRDRRIRAISLGSYRAARLNPRIFQQISIRPLDSQLGHLTPVWGVLPQWSRVTDTASTSDLGNPPTARLQHSVGCQTISGRQTLRPLHGSVSSNRHNTDTVVGTYTDR
ncbi:hypothetical protein RRG08_016644 [Elysia crispata]|uniref:Uncharacterized protein n=1 Tax=Elysia crispata TaxID=231223 RepID=A0AAE0YX22_9GAST|nr:hypothetical protein RRG08_016644 [Elysia crispata]